MAATAGGRAGNHEYDLFFGPYGLEIGGVTKRLGQPCPQRGHFVGVKRRGIPVPGIVVRFRPLLLVTRQFAAGLLPRILVGFGSAFFSGATSGKSTSSGNTAS